MKMFYLFVIMVSSAYATPNRITDLTVVSVSGTKVVLSCTVPKTQVSVTNKNAPQEPVSLIELRTDDSFGYLNSRNYDKCRLVQVIENPGPAQTKVVFTAEGLEPNTKYYFACRASDSKWNLPSNTVSVTTGDADRAPHKTIRVSWRYGDEDEGSVPDVVIIFHGPTMELAARPIALKGDVFQTDITGLPWGTPYYWQVVTVNAAGGTTEGNLRSDSK